MMNKKGWPIITVGLFVFFIVLGLVACVTSSGQWKDVSYSGEDSEVLASTAWTFIVDDESWNIRIYNVIDFFPDGSLQASYTETVSGFSGPITTDIELRGKSSWERVGLDVKLALENGNYYGEGKHDPETNYISGTLFSSDGKETKFSMDYIGVANTTPRFLRNVAGMAVNRSLASATEFSISGSNNQKIRVGNRFVFFTSITGYTGSNTSLRIPPIIDGLLVTSIREGAFANKQLTNVIIPDAVNAGRNNNIKHETIVDLGKTDGISAPDAPDIDGYAGIGSIGNRAFANNNIVSITIGANITISESAFDNMFVQFYESNERQAGRYTLTDGQWSVEFR